VKLDGREDLEYNTVMCNRFPRHVTLLRNEARLRPQQRRVAHCPKAVEGEATLHLPVLGSTQQHCRAVVIAGGRAEVGTFTVASGMDGARRTFCVAGTVTGPVSAS
jgi:hypothetical protein